MEFYISLFMMSDLDKLYLLVMSVSPYMGSLHIWAVFVECIGDVSIGDVTMSQ